MFGTYRQQPRGKHEDLKLGLPEHPNSERTVPLMAMLLMPWQKKEAIETCERKEERAA